MCEHTEQCWIFLSSGRVLTRMSGASLSPLITISPGNMIKSLPAGLCLMILGKDESSGGLRRKFELGVNPFSFAHGKVWGASSFENQWERFLERSPACRLPMTINFWGYRWRDGLRRLRGVDCKYNKRDCSNTATQFRLLFSQAQNPKCPLIFSSGMNLYHINQWVE